MFEKDCETNIVVNQRKLVQYSYALVISYEVTQLEYWLFRCLNCLTILGINIRIQIYICTENFAVYKMLKYARRFHARHMVFEQVIRVISS